MPHDPKAYVFQRDIDLVPIAVTLPNAPMAIYEFNKHPYRTKHDIGPVDKMTNQRIEEHLRNCGLGHFTKFRVIKYSDFAELALKYRHRRKDWIDNGKAIVLKEKRK